MQALYKPQAEKENDTYIPQTEEEIIVYYTFKEEVRALKLIGEARNNVLAKTNKKKAKVPIVTLEELQGCIFGEFAAN